MIPESGVFEMPTFFFVAGCGWGWSQVEITQRIIELLCVFVSCHEVDRNLAKKDFDLSSFSFSCHKTKLPVKSGSKQKPSLERDASGWFGLARQNVHPQILGNRPIYGHF